MPGERNGAGHDVVVQASPPARAGNHVGGVILLMEPLEAASS